MNRFAFAALKGILCHFPGGRGNKREKLRQENNRKERGIKRGWREILRKRRDVGG